jgi:hypothetical protein
MHRGANPGFHPHAVACRPRPEGAAADWSPPWGTDTTIYRRDDLTEFADWLERADVPEPDPHLVIDRG